MRLSQVFVVIAASFLFTSKALSATTDSNQAKISNVASPGDSSHHLLRAHHPVEEEDDSEERGWSSFSATDKQALKDKATRLGFNLEAAMKDQSIFNGLTKAQLVSYQKKFNKVQAKYRNHGAPMINYGLDASVDQASRPLQECRVLNKQHVKP